MTSTPGSETSSLDPTSKEFQPSNRLLGDRTSNWEDVAKRESRIFARETASAANGLPKVFLVSLSKMRNFDQMYRNMLRKLHERADVYEAKTSFEFMRIFSERHDFAAIIITDETLAPIISRGNMIPQHPLINAQLKFYAQSGGTVIMACEMAFHGTTLSFNSYIMMEWGVPWIFATRIQKVFAFNSLMHPALRDRISQGSYMMNAVCLANASPEEIVLSHSNGSPAIMRAYGSGFLGWLGDTQFENGSVKLLIAMCNLSREPIRGAQRGSIIWKERTRS